MQQYQNKTLNFYNNIRSMHPGCLYDLNMKMDKETLLNKINASIMIEFHEHPLYSCLTPQRAISSEFWTCGLCGCSYKYNVPSFYCTACNYDFCQRCLMQCKLFTIQMYDYSKKEFNNMSINPNHLNTSAHNHKMALIQIENYDPNNKYVIHCKSCKGNIKNNEHFYYCSLCNFYICQKCFVNSKSINNNCNPFNQFSDGIIQNNFNYNNLNNVSPEFNNFSNNINNKVSTNVSNFKNINFGQNIINNKINKSNINNINNDNNINNSINNIDKNINDIPSINNINNIHSNEVSLNSPENVQNFGEKKIKLNFIAMTGGEPYEITLPENMLLKYALYEYGKKVKLSEDDINNFIFLFKGKTLNVKTKGTIKENNLKNDDTIICGKDFG